MVGTCLFWVEVHQKGGRMRTSRTSVASTPSFIPKKRCAIYTRKSTDEGLDQEYNSLEAQRDAGLAFVSSQRHEGWLALDDTYDDGGFSGGNIDRPGLKRLMADIEARKIDVVVVYKIDRLTRSLDKIPVTCEVYRPTTMNPPAFTAPATNASSSPNLKLVARLRFLAVRVRNHISICIAQPIQRNTLVPFCSNLTEHTADSQNSDLSTY